jgi:hypothetical protein
MAPPAYTVMLSLYDSDVTDAACPLSGPLQVVVVGGQTTSAVNHRVGCRIDVSTVRVPTIDDMFDQAIIAQAAVNYHSFVLDPVWGFPSSFDGADRSHEVFGTVSMLHPAATETLLDDEIATGLDSFQQRWTASAPAAYDFTLHRLCFCPFEGPFTVSVVDGSGSAVDSTGDPIPPDVAQLLPMSIEALFEATSTSLASSSPHSTSSAAIRSSSTSTRSPTESTTR